MDFSSNAQAEELTLQSLRQSMEERCTYIQERIENLVLQSSSEVLQPEIIELRLAMENYIAIPWDAADFSELTRVAEETKTIEQQIEELESKVTDSLKTVPGSDEFIDYCLKNLNRLPDEFYASIRERKELWIPRLIQIIDTATKEHYAQRTPQDNAHFHALMLLAEFRATEALPTMLASCTLPGEAIFELYGDFVTEGFNRILAILAKDDPQTIDALVKNPQAHEYVRSVAVDVYAYWVNDGFMSRAQAQQRLYDLFQYCKAEETEMPLQEIALALCEFRYATARAEIEESTKRFENGDIFPLISFRCVNDIFKEGEAGYERWMSSLTPIANYDAAVENADWWHETTTPTYADDAEENNFGTAYVPNRGAGYYLPMPEPDFIPPSERIGPNAPCSCGSGKKFKKCCGKRS
jgi:Protein of unknown function (DUF1186)/SEC-C motif